MTTEEEQSVIALREELKSSNERNAAYATTQEELNDQIEKHKMQVALDQKDREIITEQLASLNETVTHANSERDEAKGISDAIISKVERLEKEVFKLESEIKVWKKRVATADRQIEMHTARIQGIKESRAIEFGK